MVDTWDQFDWTQLNTDAILNCVDDEVRDSLLLCTAYRKRIRPIPPEVHQRAVTAFKYAAITAEAVFDTPDDASQIMDQVCERLWNELDEETRYAWLLKVV